MYAKNVIAAGALLSVVAAVPMVKRDVVWVTETAEDVVTVPITTTVWVNPGESVPTTVTTSSLSHYGHHRSHSTIHVQSTVTVPAAPSSSAESSPVETSAPAPTTYAPPPTTTSTEAAPTTSSTEAAPTTSSTEAAPTTPSTTSVYVAPTTTSTPEAAPTTPTSTWVQTSTSTSAAPAATSYASGSGSGSSLSGDAAPGTKYTGDLTWYQDGLGACGLTNGPSDHIVAIAESLFDEYTPSSGNPNDNPLCGKSVTITGVDGSPYTATIVDRCTGCQKSDLDLSEDFFNSVTDNGDGRVHNMSWQFD